MSTPPDKPSKRRPAVALGLLALALAALLLRVWGLDWGVPSSERYYPYHPDELVLLHAACQVNPLWGDFTPEFYNYGSLTINLSKLAYDLIAPVRHWEALPRYDQPFGFWVADFARLLLLGRGLTVLFGVGTVLATFWLGRRLYSQRAGWIAGALAAVAPILVLFGHYMTVDVPVAFFTTLSLGYAAAALAAVRADEPRRATGWLAAAGAAAGLAAGVKYNGALALASCAVPCWMLWRSGARGRAAASLGAAGAAALAAFLLSTPGVLLQTGTFLKDFTYELGRNVEGQGLIFVGTPPAWLYHLQTTFPVALEWPLYLLVAAGLGWSAWRRKPEDVLLWLFVGSSFLALAGAERKFIRYLTPLIPPLLVLAARAVEEGLNTRAKPAWAAAGLLAGLAPLASTIAHLGVLSGVDPRSQAAAYLGQRAATSDIVALATDPWTWTPPVHPTAGCVKLGEPYGGPPIWEQSARSPDAPPVPFDVGPYRVLAPRMNTGTLPLPALRQYRPRWVVMSDYEYQDPERLRQRQPDHPLLVLEQEVAPDYRVHEIRVRPSLFGFTWWKNGIPPHDWRYYMPSIRIYERNSDR